MSTKLKIHNPIFIYLNGKYKYVGENYHYEGKIYWKSINKKEEIVIGK